MKKEYVFFISLCLLWVNQVENARILSVLPLPFTSHFIMFKSILEELANRGHEVDVVTPLRNGNISGVNYIKIEDIYANSSQLSIKYIKSFSFHEMVKWMFATADETSPNICRSLLSLEGMKQIRDSKKNYDLLILEVFVADCLFGFAHVFKAPVVAVTSSVSLPWGANRLGNPDNPSYIPNYFQDFSPEMTLYERVENTLTLIHAKLVHMSMLFTQELEARMFFGNNIPTLDELVSNSSLFIVNSHFSINQARPNVPNVIEAAGLHIKIPKRLVQELQDFLGTSNFIYFSFGSYADSETLTVESVNRVFEVAAALKHKLIWKADPDKLPNGLVIPKDVYVSKWLPQLDILCHPNISFFITHSGLLGTQEAVFCGVPMLTSPIFADQYLNSKSMVHKRIALQTDLESVSKEALYSTIKQLIVDLKFKENVRKLSTIFRDRPRKSLNEAIYWIEYVIRHDGAPQLRSRAADLEWYKYYLVDVIVVIILAVTSISYITYILFKYIFSTLFRSNQFVKCKSS